MASVIFCDGFDHYSTVLDKWDVVNLAGNSPTAVITPGAGRGGAGAFSSTYSVTYSAFVANSGSATIGKNVGNQTTMYLGFAFNWNPSGQVGDVAIAQFVDAGTVQVTLWITTAGTMYFTRGNLPLCNSGTALGSAITSVPYASNSYHYVEVEVTISATVGVCVLRIDQSVVLNLTGLNTKNSSNASFNELFIGCASGVPLEAGGSPSPGFSTSSSGTCLFDDIYFDTAGFNGDVRVAGLLPTGNGSTQNFSPVESTWAANTVTKLQTTIFNGTHLQRAIAITGDFKTGSSAPTWNATLGGNTTDNHVTWMNLGAVSHFLLVNESDPDGDSSYLQSANAGDIERFTYPAVNGTSVLAVVIWANARKDDGGFRTIQGSIKSGSTVGTTGTDVPLGASYQSLPLLSTIDPNTGAAWSIAGVNAAEFGVKITN